MPLSKSKIILPILAVLIGLTLTSFFYWRKDDKIRSVPEVPPKSRNLATDPADRQLQQPTNQVSDSDWIEFKSITLNIIFWYPKEWGEVNETELSQERPDFVSSGLLRGDRLTISFTKNRNVSGVAVTTDYEFSGDALLFADSPVDSNFCNRTFADPSQHLCQVVSISEGHSLASLFFFDRFPYGPSLARSGLVNLASSKYRVLSFTISITQLENLLPPYDDPTYLRVWEDLIHSIERRSIDAQVTGQLEAFDRLIESLSLINNNGFSGTQL